MLVRDGRKLLYICMLAGLTFTERSTGPCEYTEIYICIYIFKEWKEERKGIYIIVYREHKEEDGSTRVSNEMRVFVFFTRWYRHLVS